MALVVSFVVLAGLGAREAEARPRFRDRSVGFRLRLSASYGWVDYDDISRASNGRTSFVSAPHMGRKGELEAWIPRLMNPWPLFGVIGDLDTHPLRLFGRQIAYSQFSGRLAWRLVGGSGNWNRDEFVMSAGPSVQLFPDVRAFPRTQTYDMLTAGVLGLKVEARYRFKLSQNHRKWRFDIAAHWTMPLSLYRTSTAELDKQQSRSFGLKIFLDRNLTESLDVGLGLFFERNRLGYRPIESANPQTIEWNNIAPMFTIQLWLAPGG